MPVRDEHDRLGFLLELHHGYPNSINMCLLDSEDLRIYPSAGSNEEWLLENIKDRILSEFKHSFMTVECIQRIVMHVKEIMKEHYPDTFTGTVLVENAGVLVLWYT